MAEVDPETFLEWLQSGTGGARYAVNSFRTAVYVAGHVACCFERCVFNLVSKFSKDANCIKYCFKAS